MVVVVVMMMILTLCTLQLPPQRSCTNMLRRHPPKTKRVHPFALPTLSLRIEQTACRHSSSSSSSSNSSNGTP
jgi:hypothetical protein